MDDNLEKLSHEVEKQAYLIAASGSSDVNDETRLRIALNLLKAVDNLYMGTGEMQIKLFREAEKFGVHILRPHFYSPLPIISELDNKIWNRQEVRGINWNEKNSLILLEDLAKYANEFKELLDSNQFNVNDGQFRYHDPATYYAMIRHFKPKKIMEVGAGATTKLASLAIKKNSKTDLISIDPYAPDYVRDLFGLQQLIKEPVQNIEIKKFQQLKRNDILFIDSSHISKIGSDVNYLFLEVMPSLNEGVLIHIHDIFLPLELPKDWIERLIFWNEQYLLHAFLIGNKDFEVLFGNRYMSLHHPESLHKIYANEPIGGGSFWMRKMR